MHLCTRFCQHSTGSKNDKTYKQDKERRNEDPRNRAEHDQEASRGNKARVTSRGEEATTKNNTGVSLCLTLRLQVKR